jgi:glycosyltransferase involved in cell wall biosynthesis
MHVLELSFMYPSPRHPTSGVFIERQVRELARRVALDVVSPVPWAPRPLWPLSARWRAYGQQPRESRCHGIVVHHPRYLQPVGQWSIALAGVSMAAGAAAVVAQLAQTRGVDVLHAHQLLPDGLAAVLLGRRLGRPVVCTLHGSDVNAVPFHDRVARAAARFVVGRVRAITAVAPVLLGSLARLVPEGTSGSVIPNGVDLDQFRPHDRVAARDQLGLRRGDAFVLYAGALTAGKGVELLLEAFARLAARVAHARLLVVGGAAGGVVERDDRGRVLAEAARRLGCADRVRFVGRRPHEEMPYWLSAADVVALASRSEGFPNVIREAIACGTPCVVSALPGMADVVGAECGAVVPQGDVEAFADALAATLERGFDRAALRRRAEGWQWERSAAAMLDVLERAAA